MDSILEGIIEDNDPGESMEKENKIIAPLLDEIDLIQDMGLSSFVRSFLCKLPNYFWEAPATFSENIHPPDERVQGGGIVHIKRVVRTAFMLAIAQDRPEEERDALVAASILHDATKAVFIEGQGLKYDPMHVYTVDKVARWVQEMDEKHSDESASSSLWVQKPILDLTLRLVRCHMGIWSPIPETLPATGLEWLMHFADLISSRMHVIIDGDEIEEWRWKTE